MLIGVVLTILWQRTIKTSPQQTKAYMDRIQTLMPEPQGAVVEARNNNVMPVLSLDGTDFVGILEMPLFGSRLPVSNDWGKTSKYPCRFGGSIYDGSMKIGVTSQKGQYDFYRDISVGDSVFFTDMTGNRYGYSVIDVCYEKHANSETLKHPDASLTVFVKNVYAFEYILIFCAPLS